MYRNHELKIETVGLSRKVCIKFSDLERCLQVSRSQVWKQTVRSILLYPFVLIKKNHIYLHL